jgi:hypothetical protein
MAARTPIREHFLAARDNGLALCQVLRATGRIAQVMRLGTGQEKPRHVGCPQLCGAPVHGILHRRFDRNRCNGLPADDRTEMQQPFFAEQADVQINAIQRAERTYRIRSILEHPRCPDGARPGEELRKRIIWPDELVELLVQPLAAQDRFTSPFPRQPHPRREVVHGIHRPRVVDVVRRDERGVEGAGTGDMERLKKDARLVVSTAPVEDAVPPEVLRSDVRAQVFPFRVVGVGRRPNRIGADMAEGA